MEYIEKNEQKYTIIDKTLIRKYRQYLKLEKSFSNNTIDAYEKDLQKLLDYLENIQLQAVNIKLENLHQFAATLYDIDICPRSIARILSGIRAFYRFLILEHVIDNDPTELLETPKIKKSLPEVLSVAEIDRIIAAIDLSKDEGQRNRAIIEMLYSCGLRVTELCQLKLSDLFLDQGFIRVLGKGNKERLVPISNRAIKELQMWFIDRNTIQIKKGHEDFIFLSLRRGTALSRIMIFHIVKELTEICGIKKNISPHTFRHSFATHLLEGGANLRAIQAMLGHESIATTEIYMHIEKSKLREEILLHHPRNLKYQQQ